jgi:hypothetical protein
MRAISGPNHEPRSPNIELIGCQSVRQRSSFLWPRTVVRSELGVCAPPLNHVTEGMRRCVMASLRTHIYSRPATLAFSSPHLVEGGRSLRKALRAVSATSWSTMARLRITCKRHPASS